MRFHFIVTSLFACLILSYFSAEAQNPSGRTGMRDPTEMVKRDKQMLLDSIADLNNDQKLIIDQIYIDFAQAISDARKDMSPDNREAMRGKMMKIREEKDDALKAILTEEQFNRYSAILKKQQEQRRNRRPDRND